MFKRFSVRLFSSVPTKTVKAPKVPKAPKEPKSESAKSSNVVTKKMLIQDIIAETKTNVPKSVVDTILASFLKQIQKQVLENGKSVRFLNFGTFSLKEQAARTARNPRSGEEVQVPAKQKFSFKSSRSAAK